MRYIYVYVLMSEKDGKWYTGYTVDLKTRIAQHRAGESPSTRHRGPWKLIYYEASLHIEDARARERYLKSGMGKRYAEIESKSFSNLSIQISNGVRTVQELLGHSDVSTTMIYTHALNRGGRGVVSPLDHR